MSKTTAIPPSKTSESAGANPSRRKIVYGLANPPAPTVEPPMDPATLPDQTVQESPASSLYADELPPLAAESHASPAALPAAPEPREPDEYDPLWREKMAARMAYMEMRSEKFLSNIKKAWDKVVSGDTPEALIYRILSRMQTENHEN